MKKSCHLKVYDNMTTSGIEKQHAESKKTYINMSISYKIISIIDYFLRKLISQVMVCSFSGKLQFDVMRSVSHM